MASNDVLMTDTKTIINSLVIPHPNGIGLRALCNEYYDLEGKSIPYKELGFSSLTALLKSMPDKVRMIGNLQDIHSVTLYPMRSDATEHIIDMVSHQARNKKGKRKTSSFSWGSSVFGRRPTPHSPGFHNSFSTKPPIHRPLSQSLNSYRANQVNAGAYTPKHVFNYLQPTRQSTTLSPNSFANFSVTKPTAQIPNRPVVRQERSTSNPNLHSINRTITNKQSAQVATVSVGTELSNDIKQNIKQMMASNDLKEGLMLFNFDARYRHQFKTSIDFKQFGYNSLADCLKSVPQLIDLLPVGTSTFKLMPVKAINDKENREVPLNKSANGPAITTTTAVLTNGHSMAIITTTATSTTLTFVTTSSKTITTSITTQSNAFTLRKPLLTTPAVSPVLSPNPTPSPGRGPNSSTMSMSSFASSSQFGINKKAIENFRKILLLHSEKGISALDFPNEYEKLFKVSFDSRIWGYKSAMELFHSLTDVFSIETTDKNEIILHDSRFRKFEKPKPKPRTDMSVRYKLQEIPDIVKGRIMRLIEMHMPLGLLLFNFLNTYNMNYEPIELAQMRISDTSYLFQVLQTDLPIEVQMIDGMDRAFIKSQDELTEWTVQCCRQSRYIIPIVMIDTPPNVVLPGDSFRPCAVPDNFRPESGEYLAVYISSVNNPSEIFLQFKGLENHTALEKLMHQLEFYETADEDKYGVPFEFLCVGLPVVARFPGDRYWHRARITKLHHNPKRLVTVSFIDYGGITVTDYQHLRLMRREYLGLPIQALKVGLYGIKPFLGEKEGWTIASRDKVLRFSKPEYSLACTLMEYRNALPLVALCDTNTPTDIFIHDILVNDGHAVFEENVLNGTEADNEPTDETTNNTIDLSVNKTIDLSTNKTIELSTNQTTNGIEDSIALNSIQTLSENISNLNECKTSELNIKSIIRSVFDIKRTDKQLSENYRLKWIKWHSNDIPIITQNSNGACTLIAIFNVLIMRKIITFNKDKESVSGRELITLLTQHLVESVAKESERHSDLVTDIVDNNILHKFLIGIDIDIKFTEISNFETTLELKVFELLEIDLFHGWVVDRQNTNVFKFIGDLSYNQLMDKIVRTQKSLSRNFRANGEATKQWINDTAGQLTVEGLIQLQNRLTNGEPCVLFRSNHFVTLYKWANVLYELVTDEGFIDEKFIVWQTLPTISDEQEFVDESFKISTQNHSQQQSDYEMAKQLDQQLSEELQKQLDYEMALKLQNELNPNWNTNNDWNTNSNNTWNSNWNSNWSNSNNNNTGSGTEVWDSNDWNTNNDNSIPVWNSEWNKLAPNEAKAQDVCDSVAANSANIVENPNNRNDSLNAINPEIESNNDLTFEDINNDSNKLNDCFVETNNNTKVYNLVNNQIHNTLPIDSVVSENLNRLPEPLTPNRVDRQNNISDKISDENNESKESFESQPKSMASVSNSEQMDNRSERKVKGNNLNSTLSLDSLRKVAKEVISQESKASPSPKTSKLGANIKISRNISTGERKVMSIDSSSVAAHNLSALEKLDLTPNNSLSTSDTESTDESSKDSTKPFTSEDILCAKVKYIIVGEKQIHLIYYKSEFYFSYDDVSEMVGKTELWAIISNSGGYIKGRVKLADDEGVALFTHLGITFPFNRRYIFLYPYESIVEFTQWTSQKQIRAIITNEAQIFLQEIELAERQKYETIIQNLKNKVKAIKI